MINIFNREEIYCTFSVERKAKITDILEENNISYRVIVHNRNHDGAGTRSRTGTFGQNIKMMYEYYIYVKSSDAEKAKWLLKSKLGY